jgi:methanogenic corrinoid protein MtbC1
LDYFSIAQLSRFSGIKAHTIRMWEQRYDALRPERSSGNTRCYSGADLKRLLNIVSLTDEYKVSQLCRMNDKVLNSLIEKKYTEESANGNDHFISQLISAGMEFDEPSFQKILSHCLLRFGMISTYTKIIYPLLKRVGLMWSADQLPPAQEHFMSNLIRQKISTATDLLPFPKENAKKWLLILPEDEHHEIGLLMAQYILKAGGKKVYYLGASVPLNTLFSAWKSIRPDALLVFFVHDDLPGDINEYLSNLSNKCKTSTIYISGNEKLISKLKLNQKTKWLKETEQLEKVEKDLFN